MKSFLITTIVVVVLSALVFSSLPVSWQGLGSAAWVLSYPVLISTVAWVRVYSLKKKIAFLDGRLTETGKQLIMRDGAILSLNSQLRALQGPRRQ